MNGNTDNRINGVDCDALSATVAAIQAEPALAAFEFRLDNVWEGGGLNRSTVADFYGTCAELRHIRPFQMTNDEPPVLLSGDQGPNPVENLLHALAGCLTTSVVYHAAVKRLPITALRTRLEGQLDLHGFLGLSDAVRNGFSDIRVIFEIEGELTPQQKADLMAMGPRYSPVFDMVTRGTQVQCILAEDLDTRVAA